MNYRGNFCSCCTWAELVKMNKDFWLEEMIRNFSLVSDDGLSDEQCRAWISCRNELVKTLKKLPEAYKDIWLVFEYVLPKHKPGTKKAETERGIRPDVLIVGKEFVTVLEFKQRKLEGDGSVFAGYVSQAGKYVTRLNKYHAGSRDKYVAPVVVLTLARDYLADNDSYVVCSADRLADALVLLNGETPESITYKDMESWLASSV